MPVTTIPFVGPQTRRGYGITVSATKDQYFQGALLERVIDDVGGSSINFLQKRPGVTSSVVSSGIGTAIFISPSTSFTILAYGATNSEILVAGLGSGGTITGVTYFLIETIIGGTTYILISSFDGTGWYLVPSAVSVTAYTGDTHTNTVIDNISPSTSGMYVGQLISGTDIPAGTRIASITSSSAITITQAATGTTVGVAITKTPVAKIIDPDFPSMVGSFAEMDGFVFAVTSTGKIYNSNLNSVTDWSASNFIQSNIKTDIAVTLLRYKNHIACFGGSSIEFFYNAGNAFGSILSSRKELFANIGIYGNSSSKKIDQIIDFVFWIGNDLCLYTFEGFTPVNLNQQGMTLGVTSSPPTLLSCFLNGDDVIVHIGSSTSSADKWFSLKNRMYFNPNLGVEFLIFFPAIPSVLGGMASGVSASETDGKIYGLSPSSFQDDGASFSMVIQTQSIYLNDGKPFFIDEIDLIADTQSSGSTLLESTADDYASFGTIGSFGLTVQQKRLPCGGYYDSNVAFKLTDSGNNAWRGQALMVKWRPA